MSGPIDYDAELEDAEEEAAPTSEKAAETGTAGRGAAPVGGCRPDGGGTSPLWWRNGTSSIAIVSAGNGITKTCAVMCRWNIRPWPEPKIVPRWLNNPAVRQLCSGNFLDILF